MTTDISDPKKTVAVVVATTNRRHEVERLIRRLSIQTEVPDRIVVVGVKQTDLPKKGFESHLPNTKYMTVLAKPGSCHQRNVGIDMVIENCDIIVFFDDDFVPSIHAIEGVIRTFDCNSQVVGVSGTCLADGIISGGVDDAEADRIVDEFDAGFDSSNWSRNMLTSDLSSKGLYGCNMAMRSRAISANRFDEVLPLYGWLEDLDFSLRVANGAALYRSSVFVGVHQGVTHGRTPGVRLGYSQVANPVYLIRKGVLGLKSGITQACRNVLANHVKSMYGAESWIDRKGRVKGNWIAFTDLVRGRVDPKRILDIKN